MGRSGQGKYGLLLYVEDEASTTLDELRRLLLQIDVARQFFRTIYLQKELAFLSQVLLYVGLPAVWTSVATLLVLGIANTMSLPSGVIFWAVLLALSIGLVPLIVLFSFMLRTAYVAQEIASVAPFSP